MPRYYLTSDLVKNVKCNCFASKSPNSAFCRQRGMSLMGLKALRRHNQSQKKNGLGLLIL